MKDPNRSPLRAHPRATRVHTRKLPRGPKTPPRRHQEPPRRSKIIDFLCVLHIFSDLFDVLVILVLSWSNMAAKTP